MSEPFEVGPSDALKQPVLVPPRGLGPAILAALCAVATAAVLAPGEIRPTARPSLTLSSWRPTPRRMAAIRARRRATIAPAGKRLVAPAADKRLRELLHATLADEERLGYEGVRSDPRARATLGRLEEALRHLGLTAGVAALRAFAVGCARDIGAVARAALEQGVARGLSLEAAARSHPVLPGLRALDELAPGIGRTLARLGLEEQVGPGGMDPAAELVVEALVEQRVYEYCRRLPGERPRLDSELQRMVLAFRVEAHPGLALARKLELLDRLVALDPTYPALYTTAALLARSGRLRAARQRFLEAAAAGQHPEQAMANARWCRKRLRALREFGHDG